jgi:hypothetical protein
MSTTVKMLQTINKKTSFILFVVLIVSIGVTYIVYKERKEHTVIHENTNNDFITTPNFEIIDETAGKYIQPHDNMQSVFLPDFDNGRDNQRDNGRDNQRDNRQKRDRANESFYNTSDYKDNMLYNHDNTGPFEENVVSPYGRTEGGVSSFRNYAWTDKASPGSYGDQGLQRMMRR